MDQIRVQNLPEHENVQTSSMVLDHVKRFGIYIPKKNGKKRPLGIPAMHDRVEQALDLLGLDPVSETTADHHSYGFRKVRSAQDAMGAIYPEFPKKYNDEIRVTH